MDTLLQDIRFGLRLLRQSPGFTLAAVLTLALGIGANTAIFSVVNGVLLKPLPYQEPERLVFIHESSPSFPEMSVSIPNFLDWRARQRTFTDLAAFRTGSFDLTGAELPERLTARLASASMLPLLGVQPALGRAFTAEEDTLGGPRVVMLSHGLWLRRFGADPRVLGRTLTLSGEPYTVVGVLPEDFHFYTARDVWVPLARSDAKLFEQRGNHPGLYVVGRMKPGVTFAQATADLGSIGHALQEEHPDSNGAGKVLPRTEVLHESLVEDVRPGLVALVAAVACVLLIAAINVANLLLARGTVRQRELTIRAALGAGRGRLVRQLLVESSLLALMGGGLGLLLALWGVDVLAGLRPDSIPKVADFSIDGRVLGFTLLLSLGAGLLLGALPALRGSQVSLAGTLKEAGAGARRFRGRARDALVVAEVALALVLLVGAGLLMRTFLQLRGLELGFDPKGMLTLSMSAPESRFPSPDSLRAFPERVLERLQAAPGVRGATYSNGLPIAGFSENGFKVVGAPPPAPGEPQHAAFFITAHNYLEVMGIPLLEGRGFRPTDGKGNALVMVVDEVLAKRFFPGRSAVGQRLSLGGDKFQPEIIGVVKHVVAYGPGESEPAPYQFYMPFQQVPDEFLPAVGRGLGVVVRGEGKAEALVPLVRSEFKALDPDQALASIKPMEQLLAESLGPREFVLGLVGLFAALAMVLAAVGIYSVMSYVVAQRTREMGIRIALGAARADILRLVVGHGLVLAVAGVGVGVLASVGLTRLLGSLLTGVSATDPLTFGAVALALGGVAVLACWVPAQRAVRVDPVTS
ncbi:MAG: ABC transporter permease, partial [Myxococcaceae bacterium]|nr:ABC transporter permease [Myxococcaceae bacterium]